MSAVRVRISLLLFGAVFSVVLNSVFTLSISPKRKTGLAAFETENGIRIESKDAPEKNANEETTEESNDKSSNTVLRTRGWGDWGKWGSYAINNSGHMVGDGNGSINIGSPTGSFSTSSTSGNKNKGSGSSKGWDGLINNSGVMVGNGNGAINFGSFDGGSSTTSASGKKNKIRDSNSNKDWSLINNSGQIIGNGKGSINMGSPTGGFSSSSSNGNLIHLNSKGVQATVVSPSCPQSIMIRGSRVLINGQIVCQNVRRLKQESTYQKRQDGSMWHTNLSVGEPMMEDEIKKFKDEEKRMTEEAEKQKEAALKVAEEATKQAREQVNKAMEMVNSFFKNWKMF